MKNLSKFSTLSLLFLLTLVISCRPEQAAIEYNVTVKPMIGPGGTLSTLEDTPKRFVYSIKDTLEGDNKGTIDLKLAVAAQPEFGTLTDCKVTEDGLEMDCLYSPSKDFNGEDKVQFKSVDGDFESKEKAEILISVGPVPDAPSSVKNISVSVLQEATVVFDVPLAEDVDSSAGQLQYEIIQNVSNGVLKCFQDAQDVPVRGKRTCEYTPNPGFFGEDIATYNVEDETELSAESNAIITISVTRARYSAVENFTQENNTGLNSVDITWVVDNSGSMSNEQAALQASFNSFVDNFLTDTDGDNIGDTAKFPFKMIVTSTEAYRSDREKFRKDPATDMAWDLSSTLAESDFNKFKANFNSAALMGVGGSGSERSLESADALYQAKSDWYGLNDTLSVYIFLSDEAEQSTSKTVAEWVTQFQALKDDAAKTRFYPIININEDNGDRYKNMATLTQGKMYDINLPFNDILDDISLTVTNLLDSYSLEPNRVLYESTLKVYINDVEQTSGWTYLNHGIKFDTAPPANAVIKVTYDYSLGAQ